VHAPFKKWAFRRVPLGNTGSSADRQRAHVACRLLPILAFTLHQLSGDQLAGLSAASVTPPKGCRGDESGGRSTPQPEAVTCQLLLRPVAKVPSFCLKRPSQSRTSARASERGRTCSIE
jgi:hypothetical protein